MNRISIGVLWTVSAAVLLSGCVFSPPKKPPVDDHPNPYPPQSSAENCLTSLTIAYTQRNIDEFRKLFSTDFVFEPAPEDVIGPDHLPSQWGLGDELEMHTNMFNPDFERPVDNITLAFTMDAMVSGDNEFPGTWKVAIHEVQLRVETRKLDGTKQDYLVDNGHATFFFKEDPEARASDGKPLWRIVRWRDMPTGKIARKAAAPRLRRRTTPISAKPAARRPGTLSRSAQLLH